MSTAFGRYTRDDLRPDGKGLRTPRAVRTIRNGVLTGAIPVVQRFVTTQSDRLDTLAAEVYSDARYWWILAAASNVGWAPQVPPGTLIIVPDLKSVERLVS
jgi:hypothetical protein